MFFMDVQKTWMEVEDEKNRRPVVAYLHAEEVLLAASACKERLGASEITSA
jgi:hypothetical protein